MACPEIMECLLRDGSGTIIRRDSAARQSVFCVHIRRALVQRFCQVGKKCMSNCTICKNSGI